MNYEVSQLVIMPSCIRKAVTRLIIQKCFILINTLFYKCYFALKVNLHCGYFYVVGCVVFFFEASKQFCES